MLYKSIGAAAFIAAITAPGMALAASAIATADVNLRAGPSTNYPVVNVVGSGDNLRVMGCLANRSWCDVSYGGQRGWMSSNYLAFLDSGRRYTGAGAVTALRAPAITFSFGSYWDDHYRGRSFYRDRDRWERDRRDRRDTRSEVREDRRELQEARKEFRERGNMRDERRELLGERGEPKDARKWLRLQRRD